MPGMLPVINERLRRAGGAYRARPQGADQPALGVRPQELLLCRTCRRATRSRSSRTRSWARARSSSLDLPARQDDIEIGIERLHLEQDAGESMQDQHPTDVLHRPEPVGRGADGNREQSPTCARPTRRRPISTKLRSIVRYLGTCDGNMDEGSMRCRRQRLGAQAQRAARHALRDQERELDPLRRSQAIEYEARRQVELIEGGGTVGAGDAGVRSQQGGDAPATLQGRCTRLPLLPRSRPAAARILTKEYVEKTQEASLPELPDARKTSLRRRATGSRAYDAGRARSPRRRRPSYFETVAKGRDAKHGGQLGDRRLASACLEHAAASASARRRLRPPSSAASST